MNLKQIKDKYKQILEDPEQDNSQDQWKVPEPIKNKKKLVTLTQNLYLSRQNQQENYECALLKTKEKLAQSLSNLLKKQHQIKDLKDIIFKNQQEKKIMKNQIKQEQSMIVELQKNINEQQIGYDCLEKELERVNKAIQSLKVDKQLMQQQIYYYKQQLESEKNKGLTEKRKYQMQLKDIENIQKVRKQNDRLEQDIKRLKFILQHTESCRNLTKYIENCNFLGKPEKQADMWFPKDLIGETQHFLKKNQLPYANKDLLTQFVKFINKQIKRSQKQTIVRVRKLQSQKKRETQRKNNRTLCMYDTINSLSLTKSQLKGSRLRGSHITYCLNDSKRVTEPMGWQKQTRSIILSEQAENKRIGIEIVEQFKKGIKKLLMESCPPKKKILKLVDWVCESLFMVLQDKPSQRKLIFH